MTKKPRIILTQDDKAAIGDYYLNLPKKIGPGDRKQKTANKFKIGLSTADKFGRKRAKDLNITMPGMKPIATNEQKIEAVKRVRGGETIHTVQQDYPLAHATLKNLVDATNKLEKSNNKPTTEIVPTSKPKPKPEFPSIDYDADTDEVKALKEENSKLKIKNSLMKERITLLKKTCNNFLHEL